MNGEENARVGVARGFAVVAPSSLMPSPENPRKHPRKQIQAIARSIEAFGFATPILVDRHNVVIAGHGRLEAAKLLDLSEVPIIRLEHLTPAQVTAFRIADNRLVDCSDWDEATLAKQLKELSELVLDFDVTAVGFSIAEVDIRIQSLDDPDNIDLADEHWPAPRPPVAGSGDLWHLGDHRLYCGDALARGTYDTLLGDQLPSAVFTDPPYNLRIIGMVSGNGRTAHREFAMATGEMSQGEYIDFLAKSLHALCARTRPGAVIYVCMDWRHIEHLLSVARENQLELLNICVWAKSNGGLGSFYRSQHELIGVFKNGAAPHQNNVELGRFGRNRTNVWNYAGASSFPRKNAKRLLHLHPTVKPIRMVADAILDCTKPNEIILDPFAGSGTTILAAERTRRRGFCIELDPLYVDIAIQRWEHLTGQEARHALGSTYSELAKQRGSQSGIGGTSQHAMVEAEDVTLAASTAGRL
ncbi:DNA methyltransferase [Bradyrhizobium sp. 62B]|uniref:site-specific DNA-methyltransferase n=1 Tax=Bradyrhizobium sp. 62B TaxID=2898442 RepID=UPI0025581CA4|nr:DNA methyltransferase [Bradyrhizobium sp. 62B]